MSVSGAVDEIVVIDTGSQDHTVEIAEALGAKCISAIWEHDFSKARNISLEHATKDYILVLDADEKLMPGMTSILRQTLNDHPEADGFFVTIHNHTDSSGWDETEVSLSVRLFRNRPHYRFSGALHEQIAEKITNGPPPGILLPSNIAIEHNGYKAEVVKAKAKAARNIEIAKREFEDHPQDGFRAFNLGVEYARLEDWEAAVKFLQLATSEADPMAMWASRCHKVLISSLMKLGDWESAKRALDVATSKFAAYTDLFYLRGVYYYQSGEWALALRDFASCITMGDPPIPPYLVEQGISSYKPYFAMGQIYETTGNKMEAIVAYREAAQSNPSFAEAFLRFARLLLSESADAQTLEYLYQISAASGEDLQNIWIGTALAYADHFALARPYLEKVRGHAAAFLPLGIVYASLGDLRTLSDWLSEVDVDGSVKEKVSNYLIDRGRAVLDDGLKRFPDDPSLQSLRDEFKEKWGP